MVFDLNIVGTAAVLEFCRIRGSKIVYAGSSTKFGDGGAGKDQSPYAWSKSTNSTLVRNYGSWFGVPYAIAYFYNVYGPHEITRGPYATVIGIFKEEYKHGEPLTVVSPGTQRRIFTHVKDIVSALARIGESGEGDDFGIGADQAFSIFDVAALFGAPLVMLPARPGNRQEATIDTTKTKSLGWAPTISLEEEIRTFCKHTTPRVNLERRILVFSTTFDPVMGPAELALKDLAAEVPDCRFDIVTSLFASSARNAENNLPNVAIHRVGYGSPFDKYLLPVLGVRKARRLMREHSYLFSWSLLASYGTLAAVLLKRVSSVPLLITLADQRFTHIPWLTRVALRFVLGQGDQVYASNPVQEREARALRGGLFFHQSLGKGDAFANQVRFAYSTILRKYLTTSSTTR